MFRFQKEQEIVNIAGTKIGGQPGELPTALAGTIIIIKLYRMLQQVYSTKTRLKN